MDICHSVKQEKVFENISMKRDISHTSFITKDQFIKGLNVLFRFRLQRIKERLH